MNRERSVPIGAAAVAAAARDGSRGVAPFTGAGDRRRFRCPPKR